MPHINGSFFVLKCFDNVENVLLDFFDMLGVDKSCNFTDKFHEDSDSVGTEERKCNTKVRVIFVQFDSLQMLLDSFIYFMGYLC